MSKTLFDLSGKTALVTGSARGIGFSLARGLAKAGAKVLLNGRSPEVLEIAAKKLQAESLDVSSIAFDVSDEFAVQSAFTLLDQQKLEIDILINNAGIQFRKPILDLALTDWQRVIQTNLTSAFLVGREVAARMIARKVNGKIINIASLTSEAARATVAPYTAAKGGLKMLTRAMAAEWAEHDIQVNAIGPGYILTDMNEALINDKKFDAWVKSSNPAKRWGRPDELIGTAVYLSSAASSYVNGQIIYVDGGWLSVL